MVQNGIERLIQSRPIAVTAPAYSFLMHGAPDKPLLHYFRKKVFHIIPVMFLVTVMTFLMLNLVPGDVVDLILGDTEEGEVPSEKEIKAVRAELGLDKPVVIRYFQWLGNGLTGDLGKAYGTGEPVIASLKQRLPVTLQLLVMTQILALLFAVPSGIFCAFMSGKVPDQTLTTVAFGVVATPNFIIGIILMFIFAVNLGWFPATGYKPLSDGIWANLQTFALPSLTIAIAEWPTLTRVLRNDVISTLQEDYISLAKSKGLSTTYILFAHALRPSSFTLLTIIGLQLGGLIGGSIIVETVFAMPGLGLLLIESVTGREVIVVQSVVAFIGIAYVLVNFAVDILYGFLDPRVRR